MIDTPKISVIMPIYNAEKHLEDCLGSVLNQTLKDIEVICINDGSTDGTEDIIKKHMKEDRRIIYIYQKNDGSSSARNKGIQRSKGKYLVFIDADDYYPSLNVLDILYKKAEQNKATICGGDLVFDLNGKITPDSNSKSSFSKEDFIKYVDYQWSYGFYRYIYNSQFIKDHQIFFPNLIYYEDPPFLMEAMIKAKELYAVNEETYCYRLEYKNESYWNKDRINDLAKGILICIKRAKKEKMFLEVSNHIKAINEEYLNIILSSLADNNNLLQLLKEINVEIEDDNYKKSSSYIDISENIKSIIEKGYFLKTNNKKGESSTIEIIKEKTKGVKSSLKENGIKYTLNRILYHLNLAEDNDVNRTFKKHKHD